MTLQYTMNISSIRIQLYSIAIVNENLLNTFTFAEKEEKCTGEQTGNNLNK